MATLEARLQALAGAVRDKINLMVPRLLPAGGSAGQVLGKSSGANYAVGWVDAAAGGGGATNIDGGSASSIGASNIDGGTAST